MSRARTAKLAPRATKGGDARIPFLPMKSFRPRAERLTCDGRQPGIIDSSAVGWGVAFPRIRAPVPDRNRRIECKCLAVDGEVGKVNGKIQL